jgi:hypothetical protein
MKDKINKIMIDRIENIIRTDRMGNVNPRLTAHAILLVLNENTEGVSNDTDESGVLHVVGDSHASEPTDKDSQSFVDGTLDKITHCEKFFCTHEKEKVSICKNEWDYQCFYCKIKELE